MLEVAEFVDDQVVLGGWFEEEDAVAEIEVAAAGAAAPAGLLVADGDAAVGEFVVGIEMLKARMRQHARLFTVFLVHEIAEHRALIIAHFQDFLKKMNYYLLDGNSLSATL